MADVYKEFDALRKKHGIRQFDSCCVSRQYAFEVAGIPLESEYLKVAYSFTGKVFTWVCGCALLKVL